MAASDTLPVNPPEIKRLVVIDDVSAAGEKTHKCGTCYELFNCEDGATTAVDPMDWGCDCLKHFIYTPANSDEKAGDVEEFFFCEDDCYAEFIDELDQPDTALPYAGWGKIKPWKEPAQDAAQRCFGECACVDKNCKVEL